MEVREDITIVVKREGPMRRLPRDGRADAIIRRNVLWSFGAGLLLVPLADVAVLTAVQLKLLGQLSNLYEVKFSEELGKKLIAALVSGVGAVGVGVAMAGSLVKIFPGVGTVLGAITMPVLAAASTHAIGKVFEMHFESGGTLLDFDPRAMRAYFKEEFEAAERTVAEIR